MTTPGRAGVLNLDQIEDWAGIRARAIDAFDGEMPNPMTESVIIEAYEAHPDALKRELAKVAADFGNGTIRSGWGILKSRAERVLAPPSNPTATSSLSREKAIARAEQWIRSTGCHHDRETELVDDLFGDRGLLEPYAGDHTLEQRMTALWTERRPIAEALEHEAQQAADRWKAQQTEHPWNGHKPAAFPTPPPS